MKKVLSAIALTAALVGTMASNAQANQGYPSSTNYNEFWMGSMVAAIYTQETEILLHLGDFATVNVLGQGLPYQHTFQETDKLLQSVDYQSILASRNDTGDVRVSMFIHDMWNTLEDPRYWDIYYTTTSPIHGGEVPTWDGYLTTSGESSQDAFTYFNTKGGNVIVGANLLGQGADILVRDTFTSYSFTQEMNAMSVWAPNNGEGSYGELNYLYTEYGELKLENMAPGYTEADLTLWHVRHDTKGTLGVVNDESFAMGSVATIRFNTETGTFVLNPTSEIAPVPVPAAAWLLGSGLLGLVGLRRRK